MATNYYFIRKSNGERIHVGKYSYGWKFAVNYNNGKYFALSKKSFLQWILNTLENRDEYYLTADNGSPNSTESKIRSELMDHIMHSEGQGEADEDVLVIDGLRFVQYEGDWC